MKIILTTDLHEGFDNKTNRINSKFITKMSEEIKKDADIKVMVVTGDLASHKQRQLPRVLKMLRTKINIPILVVRGNHDLWDTQKGDFGQKGQWLNKPKPSIKSIYKQHEQWFHDNDIRHLESGNFEINDIVFIGWDGWYHSLNPPTNDEFRMTPYTEGIRTTEWLTYRAEREFNRVIFDQTDAKIRIAVTHHSPLPSEWQYKDHAANPKFLQQITCRFNYFLIGHTHQETDMIIDDCRIINAGSDYNAPKYKIFEV
ncbi:MAG: metallophosphoesterase [Candidatus Lokiarchaeota archaeon]|nr:metallophosphoesterase [Candidatus Lokiarchaeota archaeon]